MRAIFNIGFQFTLACALLMCITCNRLESDLDGARKDDKIIFKGTEFVEKQITYAAQLIELAEIGEHKGNAETSLKASALKDNQIAILYYWIDYASVNNIDIPAIMPDKSAEKLLKQSERFDQNWSTSVDERTRFIVDVLKNQLSVEEGEMKDVISNSLNLLEKQSDLAGNQLVAGN